jgi:hypothetical protein
MTTGAIADPGHQMGSRTRKSLLAAGVLALFALAFSALALPATARAYDDKYYTWCTSSLGQQSDVCCTNAGGELFNGGCFDPQVLHPPVTAVPTVTQQILSPAVIGSPP